LTIRYCCLTLTLKNAIEHLSKIIPNKDHSHIKVLTATTILTNAVEGRDFMMHVHIDTLQAFHRDVERVFDSSQKITTGASGS
jgi:hypothetical protein